MQSRVFQCCLHQRAGPEGVGLAFYLVDFPPAYRVARVQRQISTTITLPLIRAVLLVFEFYRLSIFIGAIHRKYWLRTLYFNPEFICPHLFIASTCEELNFNALPFGAFLLVHPTLQ